MPTIDLQIISDFRIKVSSITALRVKTIEGPPTISSPNLLQQVFIGFSKWIEFGTGRFVEANFRQIRTGTPELQHVNSFLVIKGKHFCIASSVVTTSLLLYQRKKSLNVHIFS